MAVKLHVRVGVAKHSTAAFGILSPGYCAVNYRTRDQYQSAQPPPTARLVSFDFDTQPDARFLPMSAG
jgi:hypothetical protein